MVGDPSVNVFPHDDVRCNPCFDGLGKKPEEWSVEVVRVVETLPLASTAVRRARDSNKPSAGSWQLFGRQLPQVSKVLGVRVVIAQDAASGWRPLDEGCPCPSRSIEAQAAKTGTGADADVSESRDSLTPHTAPVPALISSNSLTKSEKRDKSNS